VDLFLLSDARAVVRDFIKLGEGETVTVLTDGPRRAEAQAVMAAAQDVGADAVLLDISHQVASLLLGDAFWVAPPAPVVAAVQASRVTVIVLDETYGFRLDHKVRSLFETGPECSIYKVDLGMGSWRLKPEDVAEVQRIGGDLRNAMSGADRVHVTSPAGTDVRLSIRGHECLPVEVVPERGKPYAIPVPLWGEYNWAPVRGSVNGTIVIDGVTEATSKLHVVGEPVTWTVANDAIVDVRGGQDAEDFRKVFDTDAGSSLIGELGIGANHRASFGTETEKARLGTVHFGVGQNDEYPGGEILSAVHIDGVVRNARVEVDGKLLIADGRFVA
jgi:hypothetical protein